MVDRETINRLLREMENYLTDIENMDFGIDELEGDRDIQHLINHRLHIAVEIAIDIASHLAAALALPGRETAAEVFALLGKEKIINSELTKQMRQAVGFRNILVHRYTDVDYRRLYHDYKDDLKDLREFARQITRYLENNPRHKL